MSIEKTFTVKWPKHGTCVAQKDNVVDALETARAYPGTAVYRVNSDGTETQMSIPAPEAPKGPKK